MSLTDGDTFILRRDYVYVPACLLVFGTFIVKREWTIYAAVIAIAFGAYNFHTFRKLTRPASSTGCLQRQLR